MSYYKTIRKIVQLSEVGQHYSFDIADASKYRQALWTFVKRNPTMQKVFKTKLSKTKLIIWRKA